MLHLLHFAEYCRGLVEVLTGVAFFGACNRMRGVLRARFIPFMIERMSKPPQ
jgi:hypothetical protein